MTAQMVCSMLLSLLLGRVGRLSEYWGFGFFLVGF
jgi:hypothetical protein